MSVEGFGCLFLPSLAPQRIPTSGGSGGPFTSFGSDSGSAGGTTTCVGGVGVGERAFPPASGITFCSWICIDDFGTATTMPSGRQGPHPVRLLTVFKGVQGTNEQLICLSIQLDPITKSLIVSSKERLLPTSKYLTRFSRRYAIGMINYFRYYSGCGSTATQHGCWHTFIAGRGHPFNHLLGSIPSGINWGSMANWTMAACSHCVCSR